MGCKEASATNAQEAPLPTNGSTDSIAERMHVYVCSQEIDLLKARITRQYIVVS